MAKGSRIAIKDTIEIGGKRLPLKVYYEERFNATASLRITGIHIRIPIFLDENARAECLASMKAKAVEKFGKTPEKLDVALPREYNDGDTLVVGDDEYKIRISFREADSSSARIVGDTIQIQACSFIPREQQNKHVSTLISRCIAHRRLPGLTKKILELNAKHFNLPISKIAFRHSKTRWGSCSSRGNITISTRLLFAPDDVIEYVCIHELAHLIEQNHSDEFWALVEKAMPDYIDKRKWLNENARECAY